MKLPSGKIVTVFGSNDALEGDGDYQAAMAVGRKLAELGWAIANGGYGGTMEASARGAKSAGGKTIGVICSLWSSRPNEYIDYVVNTASLSQRVEKLIELGTGGYVVLPGATGTLVELAYVWELMCKGLLNRRPLVCMGGFWGPLIEMMAHQRPASAVLIATAAKCDELEAFFASGRSA